MHRIIDIVTLLACLLLLGLDIVASISCFLERRWTNGFEYVGACGFLGLLIWWNWRRRKQRDQKPDHATKSSDLNL
jgi:hypothetical protein